MAHVGLPGIVLRPDSRKIRCELKEWLLSKHALDDQELVPARHTVAPQ